MLRKAQQRHPGDVWINYDLARAAWKSWPVARGDPLLPAARSIRPETAHELAHALGTMGEWDESIAVFEDLSGCGRGTAGTSAAWAGL